MRGCHIDSDWFYLSIKGRYFCRILDDCMREIIKEQKIRKQDKHQFNVVLIQMFMVVSELFCLYKETVERIDRFGAHEFVIHWKNHYHPSTIIKPRGFVYWMFVNCNKYHTFKFERSFVEMKEMFVGMESTITYTDSTKKSYLSNVAGWKSYCEFYSEDSEDASSSYDPIY